MRTNKLLKSKTSGLTLVEIVVVLSILAILVGLSTISFLKYLPMYTLRAAARDLVGNIQYAKMQAVKTNQEYAIVFDEPGGSYATYSSPGADNQWNATADNTVLRGPFFVGKDGHGVAYGHGGASSSVTGGAFPSEMCPDPLVFDVRGRLASAAGTVYIQNGAQDTLAVTIRKTGSVVIRHWESGTWK